jgi:homoserine dehydrogenase
MLVCDRIVRRDPSPAAEGAVRLRVALLGYGQVGSAVARLAARSGAGPGAAVDIIGALVRSTASRSACCPLTTEAATLVESGPDVLVEALGGAEPARQIVLSALERGIPVVSANKTLIATHADELLAAAERGGTTLRYEAAVIAGVPFLGTLGRRPYAGACRRIEAVLNGTTNFILSELEAGAPDFATALADAQRRGYAEPNPAKDVSGADAAEKLVVLLRHLGGLNATVSDIPTSGIGGITRPDLVSARDFGGTLKPVAFADWSDGCATAFVGPAFVPATHPLSTLHGADNGIRVYSEHLPPVLFAGAGAGPDVTAATILDDVIEATEATSSANHSASRPAFASPDRRDRDCRPQAARRTSWFVRLESKDPLPAAEIADLFASYGVWVHRTTDWSRRTALPTTWLLTHPCAGTSAHAALSALSSATGCIASRWPSLESGR